MTKYPTTTPTASLKVNRAISGATTVNANCYAIVVYIVTAYSTILNSQPNAPSTSVERYFGPGQSIPTSFTIANFDYAGGAPVGTWTYTLQSGVEFINT